MNPPAALHGAMSRDRKPFTYTPGGLDLSEIKSSRMAARLMRNAMNEGVPEVPKQSIQSPPMPSTPIAVPNFNCLPVQVFPAFNLPANPKSLLRTRSNPVQSRDLPVQKASPQLTQPSQFVNNSMTSGATQYDTVNKNMPTYSQVNNNRPVSMFEYGSPAHTYTPASYGNDDYSSILPEISYDAEYFRAPPKNNVGNGMLRNETIKSDNIADNTFNSNPFTARSQYQEYPVDNFKPDIIEKEPVLPIIDTSLSEKYSEKIFKPEIDSKEMSLPYIEPNQYKDSYEDYNPLIENKEINVTTNENVNSDNNNYIDDKNTVQPIENFKIQNDIYGSNFYSEDENKETVINIHANPVVDYSTFAPETKVLKPVEDLLGAENQKKEVKIVEKQVVTKSKNTVENQNGSSNQNGDSEAEAVIKLPSKKTAAKTETKVEVTKKTLPDGSIEEVKKTITKTTIDGKTEIKTKTETTIIPKDDDEDEVEEVEEEEEENEEKAQKEVVKEPVVTVVKQSIEETVQPKENGQDNIIKTEERSETTTTTSKKIVVVQNDQDEEKEEDKAEENQEVEETEPVTFVIKQPAVKPELSQKEEKVEEPEEEEEEVEEKNEKEEVTEQEITEKNKEYVEKSGEDQPKEEELEEEVEEEEEYEEAEEKEIIEKEVSALVTDCKNEKDDDNQESIEHKVQVEKKEVDETPIKDTEETAAPEANDNKQEQTQEVTEEKQEVVVEKQEHKQEIPVLHEETLTSKVETENKVPLREPSVPLEKVEDVEIKPIGLGDFLTKTSTEKTEIITNVTEKPTGLLTEINRIENIVTVNRTTKTLDRSYEDITQQGIPTLKTYFTPHVEKIMTSPQPTRPYQPVYPPEPTTERRHSLLLERLSVERQIPSDIYQNNYQYSNQTVEQQRQWSQEPQAEVLNVSNVKPSQITNQQWYQQRENAIYNNVASSPLPTQGTTQSWAQPKPQTQPLYQPQPQYHNTPSPQPQYQAPPTQPQYQASPQPQYQPSYTENLQEKSSNTYQNTYSTYAPKPSNWAATTKPLSPIPTIITPSQPSQYSYLNKDSSESYQKTTQQFSSSSYIPPPWEQDSTYVAPEISQNYYQPPPQTSSFSPANTHGWKPNLPTTKFSKPPPTAYIPPKPNQSFVVPVSNVEPPKMPGRKTYYSEYERRYISVPESTYIPGDTSKFQHQPDPSPAYYYDNNEPTETVEPQWRRELREFTEKSQSQTTTQTNTKPPWEAETQYAKAPEPSYTPTPTWSQTVRPQSYRERSFESEFVSQEWPKTNTLGRGRPLSSYGKETIPERTRGVSVDRYNPNSYQAPVVAEHPPVQTHTHVPPAPHATGYHNPNVPAYHARASAEPREQVSYQQPRNLREARASPFQSRSFKYLQWITGTED